jgi:hypothetical protein
VTEIKSAVSVAARSVLTIEAGAVLRFTSASAALLVRGTLIANGRPDARIIFEGDEGTPGIRALQISANGAVHVHVSYATFGNFSTAVNLDVSYSWPASLLRFEDCVFEGNGAAVDGDNNNFVLDFLRCEFSRNLRPVTGPPNTMRFDGCYFHSQERGVEARTLTFVNCVFMNHTGVALRTAYESRISDSLFVSNDVAIEMSSTNLYNCTIVNNRIGVLSSLTYVMENDVQLSDIDLCGNTDANLVLYSQYDVTISRSWFGSSSDLEAYNSIKSLSSGRILFSSLRSYPIRLDLSRIYLLWPALSKIKGAFSTPSESLESKIDG